MDNEIYILMDDSGKLNSNENSCIYGGLFFYSNKDYITNEQGEIFKYIKIIEEKSITFDESIYGIDTSHCTLSINSETSINQHLLSDMGSEAFTALTSYGVYICFKFYPYNEESYYIMRTLIISFDEINSQLQGIPDNEIFNAIKQNIGKNLFKTYILREDNEALKEANETEYEYYFVDILDVFNNILNMAVSLNVSSYKGGESFLGEFYYINKEDNVATLITSQNVENYNSFIKSMYIQTFSQSTIKKDIENVYIISTENLMNTVSEDLNNILDNGSTYKIKNGVPILYLIVSNLNIC